MRTSGSGCLAWAFLVAVWWTGHLSTGASITSMSEAGASGATAGSTGSGVLVGNTAGSTNFAPPSSTYSTSYFDGIGAGGSGTGTQSASFISLGGGGTLSANLSASFSVTSASQDDGGANGSAEVTFSFTIDSAFDYVLMADQHFTQGEGSGLIQLDEPTSVPFFLQFPTSSTASQSGVLDAGSYTLQAVLGAGTSHIPVTLSGSAMSDVTLELTPETVAAPAPNSAIGALALIAMLGLRQISARIRI
jgi:hypothetical protein